MLPFSSISVNIVKIFSRSLALIRENANNPARILFKKRLKKGLCISHKPSRKEIPLKGEFELSIPYLNSS